MHVIQAVLLWFFVSSMMVSGAVVFRRFFPKESPWFGFIVPPLAFVIFINFIEHFIALPHLLILWPLLAGYLVWLVATTKVSYLDLKLPTIVFLGSFAFTFAVRCLQPDILPSSDGLSDLNKINDFSQGGVLPPLDTWLPPFRYEWYYSLQHYAASVIGRLFNVKLGVSYNVAHSLLSALTCVAGAATAHRLSGGRTWITLVVPFLIESAATGSSAYIQLFVHDARVWGGHPSLWLANNLSGGVVDPPDHNWIWQFLAHDPYRERLELQVPGFWTWRDEYHANSSGHFLTLVGLFCIVELSLVQRTVWPWVMAALTPIFAIVSSTWAWPITLLTSGGMVSIALLLGRRPARIPFAGLLLFTGLVLLWPSLYDVTSSPVVPDIMITKAEWATPWREFLIQWWPIIALWLCGCFYYRQLPIAVRWVLFVIPLMLTGVEWITVEGRYNTVEKMWGYTYGTGLIALFPIVASRAGLFCRILTCTLLISAVISIKGFLQNTFYWADWKGGVFHLEGSRSITHDDQKRRMLEILSQVKGQTFLSGNSVWCYNESPALAVFTGNRSYSAWYYFESVADFADEAVYRSKLNNDFYSGAMTNRLKFLQQNSISGVLIWPDDNISSDALAALTKDLDGSYEYVDCKGEGDKNAGVFLLRPLPSGRSD